MANPHPTKAKVFARVMYVDPEHDTIDREFDELSLYLLTPLELVDDVRPLS